MNPQNSPARAHVRNLATTSIVLVGVAALSACSSSEATPAPQAVATAAPVESIAPEHDTRPGAENLPAATPENEAEIIEQLRISADLSPEEVAQKIIENDDHWAMFGATPDTRFDRDYSISLEDYAKQVADGNTHAMAVAMFGDTYATDNNPRVDDYISGISALNYGNLVRYLSTYHDEDNPPSNLANVEVFDQGLEYISSEVVSETEDTLVLDITSRDFNNAAQTMYPEYDQYNDLAGTTQFTLVQQDDYYVIAHAEK